MRVALILVALALTGCDLTVRETYFDQPIRQTEIITAQTRRAQIVLEIERMERLLRRTVLIEDRAVIQSNINRMRFELEELNAIIQR